MILYVIIDYIGETETGFTARHIIGHTFNDHHARLFMMQNPQYHVDAVECNTIAELEDELIQQYGFIVTEDEESELIMFTTNHGKTVITTKETVYNTVSELDVYSRSMIDSIESYFIMEYLIPYMKDEKMQPILRHIFTRYIKPTCNWLYDGTGEIEESPIDMIQALIYQGYLTTIEELGDEVLNERQRY